jgi:hypothetical protein
MAKKMWRKPELRQIEAGGAESGKTTATKDASALPNTGS